MLLRGSRDMPLAGPGTVATYLSIGLIAGSVITLQVCVMRLFALGSWAHFGSLVVGLAMLAFGLASTLICVRSSFFRVHYAAAASTAAPSCRTFDCDREFCRTANPVQRHLSRFGSERRSGTSLDA